MATVTSHARGPAETPVGGGGRAGARRAWRRRQSSGAVGKQFRFHESPPGRSHGGCERSNGGGAHYQGGCGVGGDGLLRPISSLLRHRSFSRGAKFTHPLSGATAARRNKRVPPHARPRRDARCCGEVQTKLPAAPTPGLFAAHVCSSIGEQTDCRKRKADEKTVAARRGPSRRSCAD